MARRAFFGTKNARLAMFASQQCRMAHDLLMYVNIYIRGMFILQMSRQTQRAMSFLHKAAVRTTFCMIREVFLSLRQFIDKPEPVLVKEFSTMATIHVNTDQMRQLGQVFVQMNDQIANQIEPQIQNYTNQLESDWQGVSRQRYEQLYQQWRSSTQQAVQAGEDIGRHLQDTATRFEQVDQS